MANDPTVLSGVFAELPDEADYDAAYAVLMASERGRWFLTEYLKRNRQADADIPMAAIARLEAGLRGGAQPAEAGHLLEVAASLARIQSAMTADRIPAPDVSAALENILDVSFVLHERGIEASVCGALDAALREMSDALAHVEPAAERESRAENMLHALSDRVAELIALASAGRGENLPAKISDASACNDVADVAALSAAPLFELDTEQTEGLSRAVASLVGAPLVSADMPLSALGAHLENNERTESAEPAAVERSVNEMDEAASPSTPGLQTGPGASRGDEGRAAPIGGGENATSEEVAAESVKQQPVAEGEQPLGKLPTPPDGDCLAAVRALSEEELIALFS